MFRQIRLLIFAIFLLLPISAFAQEAEDPIYAWSAGLLDPSDLTAYYSFFVASGQDALDTITLAAFVPEGATFVDSFWTPERAIFVGEADGVVTWELPALDAEMVAGPFTFRATFEDANDADFAPPGAAEGTVTWDDQTIAFSPIGSETLGALENEGSVTIDAAGTVEILPIGDTGIWINVPENAVSKPVTLTITRVPITDDSDLPIVADETWWCGEYVITADQPVTFNAPIAFALPTRRALTPWMPVAVFGNSGDGEWAVLSAGDPSAAEGETVNATVVQNGLLVRALFETLSLSADPTTIAIGVRTEIRIVAVTSTPPQGQWTDPWIWY